MKNFSLRILHVFSQPTSLQSLLIKGVIIGALALSTAGTPKAIPHKSAQSPSVIEIPFRFSLEGLYREAERMVPNQAGHWSDWKRSYGIDTQYRAWRGPLAFRFSGDTLSIQTHVRYWVKARKALLGSLEVNSSCGVNEAPRQALVGLQVRMTWNPDWTLTPMFHLLPPRFLDRCEMTFAEIDVSPLVNQAFQRKMRESLKQAMSALRSHHLHTMRDEAIRIWSRMNRPFRLRHEGWLMLNPVGVAISPVFGSGNQATLHLAIALRPTLSLGIEPAYQVTPLPPLQPFLPSTPDLRFQLAMSADYGLIGRLIGDALADKIQRIEDHSLGIESVELAGKQQELYIKLRLSGQAAGSVELWVEVDFDAVSQGLRVKGLDYLFDPIDTDMYLMANMLYEKIRGLLVSTANGLIEQQMDNTRTRLEQVLKGLTPDGIKLDLERIRMERARVRFEPEGIKIEGSAVGPVRIQLG